MFHALDNIFVLEYNGKPVRMPTGNFAWHKYSYAKRALSNWLFHYRFDGTKNKFYFHVSDGQLSTVYTANTTTELTDILIQKGVFNVKQLNM